MSICFFNSNRAWGGGEKWHFTTCKEFRARGFDTVLATNYNSELYKKANTERLNVFGFRIGNLSFLNPIKILVLALFFKSQKVDSIILNLPADMKVAGLAAKLAGLKHIIYRRGMPHPIRNTWLNRFLFQNILTHVVVNSEEIGRSLYQGNEDWFPKEKIVLVYNGVDSSKTYSHKRLPTDEIIIGNAGRLTEQKGQKYLIEMAKILKARGVKFQVHIAGGGELGQSLHSQIKAAGLENEVKLLGHIDDMQAFFDSLDVFVFTSLYEGSANTLIETLHHGIPTIAFDISSNPEIVQHEKTGLLVKPFDTQGLADAVINIRSMQLTEAGKQLVKEKFDTKKNLSILEGILRDAH